MAKIRALKQTLLMLSAAISLASCNYANQKIAAPESPLPTNFTKSELTYKNVNDRIFRANCVGCHGNGGGVTLETYAQVKANLAKIYQAVIVEKKMPKAPNGSLTNDELGLLNAWIQADAPEVLPEDPIPIPLPTRIPLGPNFASIKYNILESKCLGCHAPGKSVARIPLVTLNDLITSPLEIVIPENPEESGIMLAVLGVNPEKIMPPPKWADGGPTGFSKLSVQEIEAIEVWIKNGAKD